MRKGALFLAVLFSACGAPERENPSNAAYFDLKGYFNKEAAALNHKNPLVNKRVIVNENAEEKDIKVSNWEKELSVFVDADINKAAWNSEFKRQSNATGIVYISNNEKVPVKKVQIFKEKGNVKGIVITIHNSNYLYSSSDTLSYYPDSIYEVSKSQKIKLMSPKRYQVIGRF